MTELLTAAQMRAIEQAAIESGEVTGLELMERAGQGVVEAIFEEWPELDTSGKRAVVLCGPGNNGGDGFVVARLLKVRGWEVEVFLYGDPAKLPPDARVNYERWLELGVVAPYHDEGEGAFWLDPSIYRQNSIMVDAFFGTGLTRPMESFNAFGWVTQLSEWKLSEQHRAGGYPSPRVVSVDIASGVCADSGTRLCSKAPPRDLEEIAADLTVSFHRAKLGHFLERGPELCGKVVVKDIGLKGSSRPRVGAKPPPMGAVGGCPAVPPGDIVQLAAPFFVGKRSGHKFSHGHALILTGGAGKTGAARLSARGALRIGAGLVTLGVPPSAQQEVACQITALMLQRVADAEALAEVLKDTRLNALCLGPGMGLDRARDLVPAALAAKRATVLDADALSTFGDAPEELFAMLNETCVLTPHGGEFARLFPDIADKLKAPATKGPAYSKVDATREAAARAGCVVLFKGADTVIAARDGRCSVNSAHYERAAPWLATAGSGDVLAGFITGLLARGFSPMQAAESAAWLHVDCALEFGPGLIAEDLPEQIPAVFRKLGL
ncbi:NAD(P)H-hydrate dehydratase [Phaeobacter sp. PT47_59]|uniref:NAD(P)H-hydrate dehydratase n=1 Tax=Phaeobacter sp. PT47_59 TaxID=3029979 RepID=UPI0023806556|nr:NAD(P)H-hydrate dehydratase [Phaeobacter sp. PT47_59]MDE4172689.1 NAD(P)H-hydrate dehydratase [Phaeobacter sp. PT47_59]